MAAGGTKPPLHKSRRRSLERVPMSGLLALGLRISPVRRLLSRFRWPRPEHLDRISSAQFEEYIRAIGGQDEAEAALAQHRGGDNQSPSVASVHGEEGRAERRAGATVP